MTNSFFPDLTGKVVVITGTTSGLGKELERTFKRLNATVISCNRRENPTDGVQHVSMDLADLQQVATAAETIHHLTPRVDFVLAIAGLAATPTSSRTTQGYELQMGVNYLGHAALISSLEDLFVPTTRVVLMSSLNAGDYTTSRDLPLTDDGTLSPFEFYYASKLALVLYAVKFAQLHPDMTCVSIHPGLVDTNLWRYMSGPMLTFQLILTKLFARTPTEGIQTALHCCFAPNIVNGAFYRDGVPFDINPLTHDQQAVDDFWDKTQRALQESA